MTPKEKLMGMIGLARRGKYIAYGEDLIFRIRKKQIVLILVATDISDRSQRVLDGALVDRDIKTYKTLTKDEIGQAVGHDPIAALGILNSGIAKRIRELEEEIQEDGKTV
jgi:ribosomal protein L7Ae-like RNA K-turn-binding protein